MIEEKYLVAYFDRQADYYLAKYKAYHAGDKFTFNIGSFFFGLFWFLYRKLFIEFAAIVGILIGSSIVEVLIFAALGLGEDASQAFDILLIFIFNTAYGFIGNYLYIRKADKRISAILASTDNEHERISLLQKKGGTSPAPFIVIIVGVIVIVGISEIAKRYQ